MSPFVIRPASIADRPVVEALLEAARLPILGLGEQFGEAYALAVADGTVVGAAGIESYGTAGLLRSAVVDPGWRRRGIGEALTRDRLGWARARGLHEVWLLTTTAADWFPRFGFGRADRGAAPAALQVSREFAEACPASAVAMRLQLQEAPTSRHEELTHGT